MSNLTRDGTAKPVSRDQILRRERGQRNIHQLTTCRFGNLYPVDPYSCFMCDHTCMCMYVCIVITYSIRLPILLVVS